MTLRTVQRATALLGDTRSIPGLSYVRYFDQHDTTDNEIILKQQSKRNEAQNVGSRSKSGGTKATTPKNRTKGAGKLGQHPARSKPQAKPSSSGGKKRKATTDPTGSPTKKGRMSTNTRLTSSTLAELSDASDQPQDSDDDGSSLSSLASSLFDEEQSSSGRFLRGRHRKLAKKTSGIGTSEGDDDFLATPPSSSDSHIYVRSTKKSKSRAASGNPSGSLAGSSGRSRDDYDPAQKPPQPIDLDTLLAKVDSKLLELSQKLEQRKPLADKPSPRGSPEVWADSRQALCETVPYFKKPQGGCYMNDGHVYGFLFDSVGHCREYMDPDLIICRAGGGMEMDPDGNMFQRKDQSMREPQPVAIMNDIRHKNPLIVICGNRNAKAMCKMPHQYSVLDWFKPVAIWSEKTAGKGTKRWVTIKYRLERLNSDINPAWSAPEGYSISEDDRTLAGPLISSTCEACNTTFPQIYLVGWMCLNADCEDFWTIGGEEMCHGVIPYNPAFLLDRAPKWADVGAPEIAPAPLRPPPQKTGEAIGDNLSYINTRGICCPLCGRCNPRRLFRGWVCETPGCEFALFPVHQPVMPKMLHTPWESAPSLVRNRFAEPLGVKLEVWNQHGFKICKYTFEGITGCFIHAAGSREINREPGGPDMMLANLQTEDMGLERRTFATKKSSGSLETLVAPVQGDNGLPTPPIEPCAENLEQPESGTKEHGRSRQTKHEFEDGDLMTAFSMNYGMPYKFVANGASRPFEGAPKAVVDARARLNWAVRTFINEPAADEDLNEELIFAYLQGQKIDYHDDGESGLGPRIATLSLGGRAQMHLRVKQKHYIGCSKTGLLSEERPIPCSIDGPEMYHRRMAAWEELQAIKDDRPAYMRRRREIPRELDLYDRRMKKPPDLVTVTLSHGDIVVMDGYDVQKYLEHKVVPEGYLRFALTCRTVLENHLKPEERPPYVVRPESESERYHGPQIE